MSTQVAELQFTGIDRAIQKFQNIRSLLQDISPALKDAGEYLLWFFSNDVFNSEGAVYGDTWVPLSEKYAIWKDKHFGEVPILVASGKMMQSYKLYTTSQYLLIQNEAQSSRGYYYAQAHQQDEPGAYRTPRRTMIKFQAAQLNQARKIIADYLNKIIQTA